MNAGNGSNANDANYIGYASNKSKIKASVTF